MFFNSVVFFQLGEIFLQSRHFERKQLFLRLVIKRDPLNLTSVFSFELLEFNFGVI